MFNLKVAWTIQMSYFHKPSLKHNKRHQSHLTSCTKRLWSCVPLRKTINLKQILFSIRSMRGGSACLQPSVMAPVSVQSLQHNHGNNMPDMYISDKVSQSTTNTSNRTEMLLPRSETITANTQPLLENGRFQLAVVPTDRRGELNSKQTSNHLTHILKLQTIFSKMVVPQKRISSFTSDFS